MIVTPEGKATVQSNLWIAFLTGEGDWVVNVEKNECRRRRSPFKWSTIYDNVSDKRIVVPTEMT